MRKRITQPELNRGLKALPDPFSDWFTKRGWRPYDHQLAMLDSSNADRDHRLLIAPTGGGKTLAGFLPGLIRLSNTPKKGSRVRILYLSPLKSLASDIERNLQRPIQECGLDVRVDLRTGDTSAYQRTRQKKDPADILITTPESLALLNSYADARRHFGALDYVIVDELHAFVDSKRGDLLSLNLARLRCLRPALKLVGLSATVAQPPQLANYLAPDDPGSVRVINAYEDSALTRAAPDIRVFVPEGRLPWSGHAGIYARHAILELVCEHQMSIVFVNTRAQAERLYFSLQEINERGIPVILHHGSLEKEVRREIEKDLARGKYRAVVATSSLDLGIDWGDVDLVIQVGPPKGVARLMQRIGRSNHRLDKASKAILIPTNRLEALEASAAVDAIKAHQLDNYFDRTGALEVLMQHCIARACADPFIEEELLVELRYAAPYGHIDEAILKQVIDFVATGGYALRAYDRYRRVMRDEKGRLKIASQRFARSHRMNIGTIVGNVHLKVKIPGRPTLGEVEEGFIQGLNEGDTFAFAGKVLCFEKVRHLQAIVRPVTSKSPQVPAFAGGTLPLSGPLARRVRSLIADRAGWSRWRTQLPDLVEWLEIQDVQSAIPDAKAVLVESFPCGEEFGLALYPFGGRRVHQALGMLLTHRMEEEGFQPVSFRANDYALLVSSIRSVDTLDQMQAILSATVVIETLEAWIESTKMMKRAFREIAIIAGLIERQLPGRRRSGKQVTFSSDLIYDVLHRYEPEHLLLEATRQEMYDKVLDGSRLNETLKEAREQLSFIRLEKVSPFAVPLYLEAGMERVEGEATDQILMEAQGPLLKSSKSQAVPV